MTRFIWIFVIFGCMTGTAVAQTPSAAQKCGKQAQETRYLGRDARLSEPRSIDPRAWKWPTIDPKAEKYYPTSPYAFCKGNPVNNIDPDGRDVWEINKQGQIVNRIEDRTQDAFHIVQQVDGQWQRMEGQSIGFEYGTVTGVRTPTVNLSDANGNVQQAQLTMFEVSGDKNAGQLFEFMGNAGVTTDVEWSHVQVGTQNSGRNIVGSTEGGVNYSAVNDYVLQTGYTVRADNHSHVYK